MLLLDTCTLLWLADDRARLSRPVLERLACGDVIALSAISIFEIGTKLRKNKLTLTTDLATWTTGVLKRYDVDTIALSWPVAELASRLPPIHNDPFDRLIIATALSVDATLLTPDVNINRYPGLRVVW